MPLKGMGAVVVRRANADRFFHSHTKLFADAYTLSLRTLRYIIIGLDVKISIVLVPLHEFF